MSQDTPFYSPDNPGAFARTRQATPGELVWTMTKGGHVYHAELRQGPQGALRATDPARQRAARGAPTRVAGVRAGRGGNPATDAAGEGVDGPSPIDGGFGVIERQEAPWWRKGSRSTGNSGA